MDKLAEQLKADAERIDVQVSDELDNRIRASLHGTVQERPEPVRAPGRPALFWWASSLTGAAAALAVIAIINSHSQPQAPADTTPVAATPDSVTVAITPMPDVPIVDWKTESAMLTEPLRQELENLQSDLKKAEEKVKRDIGL